MPAKGGFDGLGDVRPLELAAACEALGLRDTDVTTLDAFPDGPDATWPCESVASVVATHATDVGADSVVTFDGAGVSGHPNHIAVHRGVM